MAAVMIKNGYDMEVVKVPGCGLFGISYVAPRQEAENAPDTGKAEQAQQFPRVCMSPLDEEIAATQRNALFRRRCMSSGQPFTVIIDSGSQINLVAGAMVEKLGLQRLQHPTPYRISWLQSGRELLVNEQCQVEFDIDEYKDNILCDILSHMNACDILLGRPWEFDRDVIHYGRENYYVVSKDDMKYTLFPIKDEDTAATSETRSQFLKQVESPKEKVTKIEPATEKATEESSCLQSRVPVSSPAEAAPAEEKAEVEGTSLFSCSEIVRPGSTFSEFFCLNFRALFLIRGRTQIALLVALITNMSLALVESLFQYRLMGMGHAGSKN